MNTQLPANTDVSCVFWQHRVPAFRLMDNELGQVRKLIDEQLADSPDRIGRLLGSFRSCSGKMLRPGLVLLAGASWGIIMDMHCKQFVGQRIRGCVRRFLAEQGFQNVCRFIAGSHQDNRCNYSSNLRRRIEANSSKTELAVERV